MHINTCTGLLERGATRTRTFARCPFFPLLSLLRQLRRAPTRGQATRAILFSFFFAGRRCQNSSSLAQPPFPSLCWAQIFVSVLGNLPPSNSVRRGAYFVLSQLSNKRWMFQKECKRDFGMSIYHFVNTAALYVYQIKFQNK